MFFILLVCGCVCFASNDHSHVFTVQSTSIYKDTPSCFLKIFLTLVQVILKTPHNLLFNCILFKYKSGTYLELGIHCSFPRKARMLPQIFLRVKKEHNYKELMHRQELGFFLLFQLIIFENYLEKLIFALHVL